MAGTKPGPGNPFAKHDGQLRSALMNAVTESDMRAVATRLVSLAREGDVAAIKVLFDRTLGRPQEADFIERIERVEELLAERAAV